MATTGLLHVFFTSTLLLLMIFVTFISYTQLSFMQNQAYQHLVENIAQGIATQISETVSLAQSLSNGSFIYTELNLPQAQTPYKVWLTTKNNITYINVQLADKSFISTNITLSGNTIENSTAYILGYITSTQINQIRNYLGKYNLIPQQQIYMGQRAYLWLMVISKNHVVSSQTYQYIYYIVGLAIG